MAKRNFRKVMALLIAAVFVGTSLPAAIPAAEAAEKTVTLFSDAFETSGETSSSSVDDSIWKMYSTDPTKISRRSFEGGYGVRFEGIAGNTEEMYIEPKNFPDGLVKEDKIVIKYDVNLECDVTGYHALKLLAGTSGEAQEILRIRRYQDGTTSYRVYAGSTSSPATKMKNGNTYTITVTIDLSQEKDFCFDVILKSDSTAVASYQGTLEEAMGSDWAKEYKENGFSKIRWSLFNVVTPGTTLYAKNSYFDNISVTTTEELPDSIDVNVSGTAKVGETLAATVTPANADVSYQWYRYTTGNQNGTSSATPIDGATDSTYKITTDDANHYIAVTATLKDDPNVNDTSATNDEATFVKVYPWVIDFNKTINFSTVVSTKTVAAAGIRYTRSQEGNTITVENGRDGTNAIKLSTAYGTNSNTDIRTYYQWAYLNEGIIKYTMDVKIPQVLNNTAFNLRLGSTDDEGVIFNDVILGIDEVKYPINEWFTIQVTLYPETATYDCEFYLANSDVAVMAQGAEIAEKNEAFAEKIKTNGLTNARITLGAKEEEFEGAESVIIDNIAVDVLENKINVPYIVIDEETGFATATLTVNEIDAKIFLALYDSNGNIKGVYLSDASTSESKALTATSLIALPTGGSAKAFLWENTTLKPLRAISVK